jgi:aminoglycoside phosphotransferase
MLEKDKKTIEEIGSKNKISKSNPYNILPGWNENRVCIFDEKHVIKLGGMYGDIDIFSHQQKLLKKLFASGAKVPEIIDAGMANGEKYLLMTKIPGHTLSQLWPTLDKKERNNYFFQVGEELKKYHSIKFDAYAIAICQNRPKNNLLDAVDTTIDFSKTGNLKNQSAREIFEWISDYYQKNKKNIHESGTATLVFNDIRLENILASEGKISGFVDFDWLCQAAPDYELAKAIYYMYAPQYFSDASLVESMQAPMKNEINAFKKAYPDIFDTPNLTARLRMYFIRNILYLLEKYQNEPTEAILERATFIFDAFYKSNKLETFLFGK